MANQDTEKRVVDMVRLSYEQFSALEKKVGRIGVGNQTTQLEVAFQLGVQSVLKELRDGYVVGTPSKT